MFRTLLTTAALALVAASPSLAQTASGTMMVSGYQMSQSDALASKVIGSPVYSTVALHDGAASSAPADVSATNGGTAAGANGTPANSASDTNAQQIGTVRDVVMNTSGTVAAVVIGIGGVLGLGEKNVAVAYNDVKWTIATDGSIRGTIDTTADALKSAPDFQYPAHGQATKAGDQGASSAPASSSSP